MIILMCKYTIQLQQYENHLSLGHIIFPSYIKASLIKQLKNQSNFLQYFYNISYWNYVIKQQNQICNTLNIVHFIILNKYYFITKIRADFSMSSYSEQKAVKYLIGKGSFGKVYRFQYGNQQYAVKKVHKDTKNHPELIEKIQAEGRVMQKVCNHRNVVGCLGQLNKQKHVYLLTQLAPHGDLRNITFLPSQDDLWEVIMQLSMGLHHLRKNNVIHRDIKPENILIKQNTSPDGSQKDVVLKLADFGLAEVVKEGQFIQGIAGSPIYLAPQMCNHDFYSYEIDMWSMGITLYQLVNQQKSPYNQQISNYITQNPNNSQKQLFKYLTALIQTKNIKCCSPYIQVNQVINSMLQKNPKKRVTPIQILRHKKVVQKLIKFNKKHSNNLFQSKNFGASTNEMHFGQPHQQEMKNEERQVNQQKQIMLLEYSHSNNSSQIFLSNRLSESLISELKSSSITIKQNFQKYRHEKIQAK